MHRRLARHVVVATLALGLAAAPLRAQVAAPVAAHRAAPPTSTQLVMATAPTSRMVAAPSSAWHDVKVGAAIGALSGAVIGAVVATRSECDGDNSGVCPLLLGFGGGAVGFASGLVVGGVAGYVWHRTRPAVR